VVRRTIFILIIGLVGIAVLLSLGTWQVKRLAWKEGILAEIDAKIEGPPSALPLSPTVEAHKYQPIEVSGRFLETRIRVLVSQKLIGAGYRIIQPFQTDGRVILVDRGFIKIDQTEDLRNDQATILGNLHWPEEVDQYTPEPDLTRDIWFARDVPELAAALNADPILVIAREITPSSEKVSPIPISSSGIPNDHLQYAITWFSLVAVWAGMSGLFLFGTRRRKS
jgi:surfeit locus 1 family protein